MMILFLFRNENFVTEVKEEMIDYDSFSIQEIHKPGDGGNPTVVDDIDLVR